MVPVVSVIIFSCIFVVGLFGNCTVICMVGTLLLGAKRGPCGNAIVVHLYYYVLALSVADLSVMVVMPFMITEMVRERWSFGDAACKIYWSIENTNKIMSIFILTVLSVDRYLAICRPHYLPWLRTSTGICAVLSCCMVVAVILITPVAAYSNVQQFEVEIAPNITLVTPPKCALDSEEMPKLLYKASICYSFVAAYALPALIIGISYGKLLCYLRVRHSGEIIERDTSLTDSFNVSAVALQQSPSTLGRDNQRPVMRNSDRRRRQASRFIRRIVLFHFVCWTPFWLNTLVPLFGIGSVTNWMTAHPTLVTFLQTCAHALTYINSAVNWILYVMLNKEIIGNVRKMRQRRTPNCEMSLEMQPPKTRSTEMRPSPSNSNFLQVA